MRERQKSTDLDCGNVEDDHMEFSFHTSQHEDTRNEEERKNVHPLRMQNNLVSSYYLHFRNLKYAKN